MNGNKFLNEYMDFIEANNSYAYFNVIEEKKNIVEAWFHLPLFYNVKEDGAPDLLENDLPFIDVSDPLVRSQLVDIGLFIFKNMHKGNDHKFNIFKKLPYFDTNEILNEVFNKVDLSVEDAKKLCKDHYSDVIDGVIVDRLGRFNHEVLIDKVKNILPLFKKEDFIDVIMEDRNGSRRDNGFYQAVLNYWQNESTIDKNLSVEHLAKLFNNHFNSYKYNKEKKYSSYSFFNKLEKVNQKYYARSFFSENENGKMISEYIYDERFSQLTDFFMKNMDLIKLKENKNLIVKMLNSENDLEKKDIEFLSKILVSNIDADLSFMNKDEHFLLIERFKKHPRDFISLEMISYTNGKLLSEPSMTNKKLLQNKTKLNLCNNMKTNLGLIVLNYFFGKNISIKDINYINDFALLLKSKKGLFPNVIRDLNDVTEQIKISLIEYSDVKVNKNKTKKVRI